MTCSVNKVTAIQFIVGKCHVKKRKNCKTALSSYYVWLSCDLLLLMPSGADAHVHQHSWTKKFQETRHAQATGPCPPSLK